MTPVEIIALILSIFILVKLVVLVIRQKAWMKIPKAIFAKPILTMTISIVLACVVLYFLLMEISIVHIFASMLFFGLMFAATLAAYPKALEAMTKSIMKEKHLIAKGWLPTLIWVLLLVWVLWALFV